MSVITALRTFLAGYEDMELTEPIFTDQLTGEQTVGYALAPAGNAKTQTDILGNKTYQRNYVFYAKAATGDEVDRQDNQDFVESFIDWLEEQDDAGNYPEMGGGKEIEGITVSNGLLFDVDEDGRTGLYQVQIQLIYTKE